VVGGVAARLAALVIAAAGSDVGLVADDWIDAGVAALPIEFERPIEIAMVRDRQGVHPQLFGPRDHAVDRAGPVQEAVVAVTMQMNKRRRGHGSLRYDKQGI